MRYHPGGDIVRGDFVRGDIGTGGFCPGGGFCLGGILSGGILSGGYCPGGYCPDTDFLYQKGKSMLISENQSLILQDHLLTSKNHILIVINITNYGCGK